MLVSLVRLRAFNRQPPSINAILTRRSVNEIRSLLVPYRATTALLPIAKHGTSVAPIGRPVDLSI